MDIMADGCLIGSLAAFSVYLVFVIVAEVMTRGQGRAR